MSNVGKDKFNNENEFSNNSLILLMRSFILLSLLVTFLSSCGSDSKKAKDKQQVKTINRVENVSKPQKPTLNVYNMGGVPAKDVDELVVALQKVYPDTKYAGTLSLVDNAYIKNDPKGKNRYWWSKLLPHLKKTTDTKHGISLVVVNAEVCNWDTKKKGSHANLGMSNMGGHISTISYQRLKKNRRDNVNDMLKIAIHELGHSVGRLVVEREDLRHHCPNKNYLKKKKKNGYPYDDVKTFCQSCERVMKGKGFKTDMIGF